MHLYVNGAKIPAKSTYVTMYWHEIATIPLKAQFIYGKAQSLVVYNISNHELNY